MAFRETVFSEMNKSFMTPLKQTSIKRDANQISQMSNIFVLNQSFESGTKQVQDKQSYSHYKSLKNQQSQVQQESKQSYKGQGQFYVNKNDQTIQSSQTERPKTARIDSSKSQFIKETLNDSKLYVPSFSKQIQSRAIRNSDSMKQLLETDITNKKCLVKSKSAYINVEKNQSFEPQKSKYKFKHQIGLGGKQMFFSELSSIKEQQEKCFKAKKYNKATVNNVSFYTENTNIKEKDKKPKEDHIKNVSFQHQFHQKVGQYVDKVDYVQKNKENIQNNAQRKLNKTLGQKGVLKKQTFYIN